MNNLLLISPSLAVWRRKLEGKLETKIGYLSRENPVDNMVHGQENLVA